MLRKRTSSGFPSWSPDGNPSLPVTSLTRANLPRPWTPIRPASEWWSSRWAGYASNFRPMRSSWPLNVHVIAEFPTDADTLTTEPGLSCTGLSVSDHMGYSLCTTTLAR